MSIWNPRGCLVTANHRAKYYASLLWGIYFKLGNAGVDVLYAPSTKPCPNRRGFFVCSDQSAT